MYFHFLSFTEQKVGKHLYTYMAAAAKGKRKYNLQTYLSAAKITQ